MNTVRSIVSDLNEIRESHTVDRVQVLGRGRQVIKARVYISGDLFIQVYKNDRFDTTNFAVILGGRRIYGRDERDGSWHRHPQDDPDLHDKSEGQAWCYTEGVLGGGAGYY